MLNLEEIRKIIEGSNIFEICLSKYDSSVITTNGVTKIIAKSDEEYNIDKESKQIIKQVIENKFNKEHIYLARIAKKDNIATSYEGYFVISNKKALVKISYDALYAVNEIINHHNTLLHDENLMRLIRRY